MSETMEVFREGLTKFKGQICEMLNHKYRFISDPGHGWLEVPREFISILGIEKEISGYSYDNGINLYLEEDCDMGKFLSELRDLSPADKRENFSQNFSEKNIIDVYQARTDIRNMRNYEGRL